MLTILMGFHQLIQLYTGLVVQSGGCRGFPVVRIGSHDFPQDKFKSDGDFSARPPWRDVLELDWLGHFGAANCLAFMDGQQQLSESYELPMGHHGSGNKSRYQLCSWVIPACPVYSGDIGAVVVPDMVLPQWLPLRT